jgi:alpha-D-ribose 1-methylphosphonate 5-triphosphate diphosphatase
MWLNNLKIYTPSGVIERGSLQLKEGRIAEITTGPVKDKGVNCNGLAIMPGFIDFHGDMLEKEVEPRPGVHIPIDLAAYEVDKRLAATGVTTAYAAVSFSWHEKDSLRSEGKARELIHSINQMRSSFLTDMRVHARFEITNSGAGDVLLNLLEQDLVHLISIMDHTPGQGQYRDLEHYVQFMRKWHLQRKGENVSEGEMHERIDAMQQRPKAWDAVHEIADVAIKAGIPLASHDDDTPEKVAMIAELGVNISEFPVSLEAANAARERGMYTVMGAPNALRGTSHSNNLSASEAISEGLLDILAADYYPAAMLQSLYRLDKAGLIPVAESFKLISQHPAQALELDDRGRIEVGLQADLVIIEEGDRARVRGTLREGVPIYWDQHMACLDGVNFDRSRRTQHESLAS